MTMVDWEIEAAMNDGAIVIEPYNKNQLQAVSYDVRIGHFYWRCKDYDERETRKGMRDLTPDLFEASPVDARRHGNKIVLRPYERVLAHTIESIGGTISTDGEYAVTTKISAKSTTGRYGITVCLCAGYGDPGYCRRWTLEVFNNNNVSIAIDVGEMIAQIEFVRVKVPRTLYGAKDGRYAKAGVIDTDENYDPRSMLPRRNLGTPSSVLIDQRKQSTPNQTTEENP